MPCRPRPESTAMNSNRLVFELDHGAVLPVQDAAGARVVCLQGDVWITEEGDGGDVVLEAGRSLNLSRNGCTVVQALHDARVALETPQASGSPATFSAIRLAA